jgi:hypothetical protein
LKCIAAAEPRQFGCAAASGEVPLTFAVKEAIASWNADHTPPGTALDDSGAPVRLDLPVGHPVPAL